MKRINLYTRVISNMLYWPLKYMYEDYFKDNNIILTNIRLFIYRIIYEEISNKFMNFSK